ncbi:unnamed protein product [Closterium sp. Naga37s-1]|nr:unnamed protein product [Closterium sp. Naga37s-1]
MPRRLWRQGGIDVAGGEGVWEAGLRELEEETGIAPRSVLRVGEHAPTHMREHPRFHPSYPSNPLPTPLPSPLPLPPSPPPCSPRPFQSPVSHPHCLPQMGEWLCYRYPPAVIPRLAQRWGREWQGQAQRW